MENPFEVITPCLDHIEALLIRLRNKLEEPALPEKKYLNVKEAAEILHIGASTLYKQIRSIPHINRFGRLYFIKDDLLDYIANGPAGVLS